MGLLDIFSRKKRIQEPEIIKPRAPRVTLVPLHNIYFESIAPFSCSKIPLANISTSGIGFFRKKVEKWPQDGELLDGTLYFQNNPVNIQLKIVRSSANIVGCFFTEVSENLRSMLNSYFQLELSAMKLDKIAGQYLKEESEGKSIWFRGTDNCELFIVVSEESLVRFTIQFFGNLIEYRERKTLRYSRMDEMENDLKHKGAEIVRQESSIPIEIGFSSIKFVANITELSSNNRDLICDVITRAIGPWSAGGAQEEQSRNRGS